MDDIHELFKETIGEFMENGLEVELDVELGYSKNDYRNKATDKILPMVMDWQNRPLEPIYAVVFLDAIHYHVRCKGQVVKKAIYIAIGIDADGRKDVLAMWVGENEVAEYWATVLNSLKNRGLEDILIVCADNLTGFSQAFEAVYPKADIQNCIIHQLRNSSKYVSYKNSKELMAGLKRVYAAVPWTSPPLWMPWRILPGNGARNTPRFPSPGGITRRT